MVQLHRAFARLYDSYVGDSFRVVNDMDVVARLPRAAMGTIALDYCHAGRTVMVAEDPATPPWVEGEVRRQGGGGLKSEGRVWEAVRHFQRWIGASADRILSTVLRSRAM